MEIKDYNVITNGRKVFDQVVKNDKRTSEYIRKVATGRGDDYTSVSRLDYPYFKFIN